LVGVFLCRFKWNFSLTYFKAKRQGGFTLARWMIWKGDWNNTGRDIRSTLLSPAHGICCGIRDFHPERMHLRLSRI